MSRIDGITFLLVDDEINVLEFLEDGLQLAFPHASIVCATSAEEALLKIHEGLKPSVVVTDLRMGKMSGLELAKKLVQISTNIPIILHSAFFEVLETIDNIELGFRGFVEKPSKIGDIVYEITTILNNVALNDENFLTYSLTNLAEKDFYPFDIFVLLNAKGEHLSKWEEADQSKHRYVLMFKHGTETDEVKIHKLKEVENVRFFIKKDDYLTIDAAFYNPCRSAAVLSDVVVDFNLLVKNKQGKYDCLIKKGDSISDDQVALMCKHQIKELFIDEKDYSLYQKYLDQNIKRILKAPEIRAQEKGMILTEAVLYKIGNIYRNPRKNKFTPLPKIAALLKIFIKVNRGAAVTAILDIERPKEELFKHVFNVATLSCGIFLEIVAMRKEKASAEEVKIFENEIFESQDIEEMLILPALVHDIGKQSLRYPTYVLMDEVAKDKDSIQAHVKHLEVGREILSEHSGFKEIVVDTVGKHEEFCDGSGYPHGTYKTTSSILIQIISLANQYDILIHRDYSSRDALLELKLRTNKFNQHLLKILCKLV